MNIASYTRIKKLRESMTQAGVSAVIIPGADPHLSECFADHWKSVEWLSGFTGEAGTLVITADQAGLWTDSRYFIVAERLLKGSPFALMRQGVAGTPTIDRWLIESLSAGQTVGIDGRLFSADEADRLALRLQSAGIGLRLDFAPIDTLWDKRPALPLGPIESYAETWAGESRTDRLGRIRAKMTEAGANALFLTALDEVAWALNVRGTDIHCTPVVTAYAWIGETAARLFIDPRQITAPVAAELAAAGIEISPYDTVAEELPTLAAGAVVLAPGTNAAMMQCLRARTGVTVLSGVPSPIAAMKAVKNETEIAGTRSVMLKDGIVLTRFYHWLENRLESDGELTMGQGSFFIEGEVTELDCAKQLIALRREQPLYRSESFDAIVAWRDHAAMPHYFPTPATDVPITGDGLLLIDTGAQYLDGTTDITRTLCVGRPSPDEMRDYTLVLKGHIRMATACFPEGTRGDQLDALARMDLWRDGKGYRHGTGHGVGHYLNVHEGPQSVRMEHNPVALQPGMIVSNEPAVYLTGRYGIRHENCVLVTPLDVAADCPDATPADPTDATRFLHFETLTLCFIDTRAVLTDLLTPAERTWLNAYNRHVCETLTPLLEADDAAWLKSKTAAI